VSDLGVDRAMERQVRDATVVRVKGAMRVGLAEQRAKGVNGWFP